MPRISLCLLTFIPLAAYAEDAWKLESPRPYQVVQRTGYIPEEAHENAIGGPKLGYAEVMIEGDRPERVEGEIQFRVGSVGKGSSETWRTIAGLSPSGRFKGTARLPAGWHRLELKCGSRETVVEPVGVGEVLLVAGQSYAAGANDELLKVSDAQGRVAALDIERNEWRVAHDPQPNVGEGGTIWPALGDLLVPALNVPVGFVNVAVGGTASREWLPGTPLYERLEKAGKAVGRFRAVLWQQGESDVIGKVSRETYEANLKTIRNKLAATWSHESRWLLAKSTLHVAAYTDPEGEARIRNAIGRLWKEPGFAPGPDTDVLGGESRAGNKNRRHFTGIGQRRAALLWFSSVCNEIERGPNGPWLPPRMLQFEGSGRCLVWGDKPAKPAPTLMVFATSLEGMQQIPLYSESGQHLAEHGFIVAAIDPPCHGADAKAGERADLAGWPDRCQGEDRLIAPFVARASATLDALVKEGYTDPEHVAVCGTSRGGFLAFHFAAAEPRIKAAAGYAPVTNLLALSEFAGQEGNTVVKSLNLVNVAEKLAGRPVWLSIGNHDARVSTDDAVAFARSVAAAGARQPNAKRELPVEIIVGISEGHRTPPGAYRQAAEFLWKHAAP